MRRRTGSGRFNPETIPYAEYMVRERTGEEPPG
jgi:hypothetical protein